MHHGPLHKGPAHRCTAEIIVFEDGSWAGGPLRFDGRILDKDWADKGHMVKWGWRPYVGNLACSLVIANGG